MRETPTIQGAMTNSASYNLQGAQGLGIAPGGFGNQAQNNMEEQLRRALAPTKQFQQETTIMPRRIVQVFIADPNENIPMADSLLYEGKSHMTDMTDQELFFEIDIKSILEKHNEKRAKTVDKKVKERTEYLEPAKVRDLKMVVVTVASF